MREPGIYNIEMQGRRRRAYFIENIGKRILNDLVSVSVRMLAETEDPV